MNGATFVARGYSGDQKHLQMLMQKAIEHRGFSIIDIFSPCVTFNHDNDYAFFRPRIKKLEDESHDSSDWKTACERAMEWGDTIYTGLFYQVVRPSLDALEPVLDSGIPMSDRDPAVTKEQSDRILNRML
jgi:2-oxoglutarate ferredoxin oxidoreductase subunit beta